MIRGIISSSSTPTFRNLSPPAKLMTEKNNKKKSAVLYHYPCPDGAFAAAAAHLYLSSSSIPTIFFPNTVYSPLRVEELPLNEIDDVFLLDFVGPLGFVQQLSSKIDRLIVLDHHKTALETLGDGSDCGENVIRVIDMGRSGATIAYDFFKEKLLASGNDNEIGSGCRSAFHELERARRLFDYIEDADLWRWCLQNSKAFSSGLKDLNLEFDVRLNPSLFQQKQTLINEVLDQSYELALGGGAFGHCLAVNADSVSELRSELGHHLANKSLNQNLRGIGAVVYKVPQLENDQMLKISLRSLDIEDTTSISQNFGGGGHRNASSFLLSCVEFEQWKVCSNASHVV